MKVKRFEKGPFLTNSYLLIDSNKDCLIIDPGFDSKPILKEINEKGYKLKSILLTHGHLDHIDSIGDFNCDIYISETDLIMLKNTLYNGYDSFGLKCSFDYKKVDVKILNNEFIFNDNVINIYKSPGHTKGGVIFHINSILFSGDTLFKNSVGRTDLYGGNEKELINSVFYILDNFSSDTIIYPGHGEITSVREEKNNNEYYLFWKKRYKK